MTLNLRILILVFFIVFIQVGEFDDSLNSVPVPKVNTTQSPVLESTEVNKTISDNETSIQNSSISNEPFEDQSSSPLDSIINSTVSFLESNQSSEPIEDQSSTTPLSLINSTELCPTQSTGCPLDNFNQTLSEKTIADSKTITPGFFAEPMCVVKRGLWWSNLKLSPHETWLKKRECSVFYCSADGTLRTYSCVFLNSTLVQRHNVDDKMNDALERCHEAHCL